MVVELQRRTGINVVLTGMMEYFAVKNSMNHPASKETEPVRIPRPGVVVGAAADGNTHTNNKMDEEQQLHDAAAGDVATEQPIKQYKKYGIIGCIIFIVAVVIVVVVVIVTTTRGGSDDSTTTQQRLMVACEFLNYTNVSDCQSATAFNGMTVGNTIPSELGLLTQLAHKCVRLSKLRVTIRDSKFILLGGSRP